MSKYKAELMIVSGGQSGADRAALDVAVEYGVPHGGWCPRGRWAEDGPLDAVYNLKETDTRRVIVRTRQNVIDSDATLVFTFGPPVGGSRATLHFARQSDRPYLHVDLREADDRYIAHRISCWLKSLDKPRTPESSSSGKLVLNVAGSRESTAPGIYERVQRVLRELMEKILPRRVV